MKVRSIVLAVSLGVAGLAWAEVSEQQSNINQQQQLSKRPYAAPVVDKETVNSEVVDKKEVEKNKHLNLHMLSRRPYMKKSAN
jgi:hypothetical protein